MCLRAIGGEDATEEDLGKRRRRKKKKSLRTTLTNQMQKMLMRRAAASLNHSVSTVICWHSLWYSIAVFRRKLDPWNNITNNGLCGQEVFYQLPGNCCFFWKGHYPMQAFHLCSMSGVIIELDIISASCQNQADMVCEETASNLKSNYLFPPLFLHTAYAQSPRVQG